MKEHEYTINYISLANNGYTNLNYCNDPIVKRNISNMIESGKVVEIKPNFVCLPKDQKIVKRMLIDGIY